MTIMQYKDNHGRVLYADWKVQEFRSVQRFSDYRKITARLHQDGTSPGVRQPKRRIWFTDHRLTIVIAATGVMLVILAVFHF
jgi:hypothetical protein